MLEFFVNLLLCPRSTIVVLFLNILWLLLYVSFRFVGTLVYRNALVFRLQTILPFDSMTSDFFLLYGRRLILHPGIFFCRMLLLLLQCLNNLPDNSYSCICIFL